MSVDQSTSQSTFIYMPPFTQDRVCLFWNFGEFDIGIHFYVLLSGLGCLEGLTF